jgi:hypothetical protein
MRAVANYLLAIASKHDPNLHSTLEALFSQSESHVGLVLCERLRNMPVQVIPPMYRMLADEVRWAVADVGSTTSRFRWLLTDLIHSKNHILSRILLYSLESIIFLKKRNWHSQTRL